jgi:hypothetical protein
VIGANAVLLIMSQSPEGSNLLCEGCSLASVGPQSYELSQSPEGSNQLCEVPSAVQAGIKSVVSQSPEGSNLLC